MGKFKANGESHKQLMEMIINELRENRDDCKDIKNILRRGEGKIAANKNAINYLKWVVGGLGTGLLAVIAWLVTGGI